MRIVAGSAGGIPLQAPPAPARPTMDRTREAIFSSLGERVPGARVLDIFAGSGSLGLESLSRGASRCVLVENHSGCLATLRRNAQKARLSPEIVNADALVFLKKSTEPGIFDLIFADPPYCKRSGQVDWAAELVREPALARALAAGGILILESFAKWVLPMDCPWEVIHHRVYGDAAIRFLSPSP